MTASKNSETLLDKIKTLEKDAADRKKTEDQLRQRSDFLHSVLESLSHPFCVVDANDYRIKLANSAALKSRAAGRATCHALTHNHDSPCHSAEQPCPFETVKRTGQPVQIEHIHLDSDGKPRNVEVHAHPIKDKNGNVIQVIEYSFDITGRRSIEAAGKESEARFRSVTQSATDAIITADKNGNIAFCNTAACDMFGYGDNELIGRSVRILMPERFRDAHSKGIARAKATGLSGLIGETMELSGLKREGLEFPIELSLSTWKSGEDVFYTGIIRDISRRKRFEKEREGLIDSLKKSLAKVRALSGLLPICASCKKIRDDRGYWNQIETYIRDHSEAEFSHGICPECAKKLYPKYDLESREE